MGAATVLSYALVADLFPKESAGRANAALNVLHLGGAFAIQAGIGVVVGLWSRDSYGHYLPDAYAAAFRIIILRQFMALPWFLRRRATNHPGFGEFGRQRYQIHRRGRGMHFGRHQEWQLRCERQRYRPWHPA